jgi:hypothetical protein
VSPSFVSCHDDGLVASRRAQSGNGEKLTPGGVNSQRVASATRPDANDGLAGLRSAFLALRRNCVGRNGRRNFYF